MKTKSPLKVLPKSPFFETSVKNYIYGDAVLEYAIAVDEAAIRHDVDAIFIAPYTEIRRIVEKTSKILVFAPLSLEEGYSYPVWRTPNNPTPMPITPCQRVLPR